MTIKYKQKGTTITQGITFEDFCITEVDDKIGKELLKQSNLFIEYVSETPKKEVTPKTTPKKAQTKEDKDTKKAE